MIQAAGGAIPGMITALGGYRRNRLRTETMARPAAPLYNGGPARAPRDAAAIAARSAGRPGATNRPGGARRRAAMPPGCGNRHLGRE